MSSFLAALAATTLMTAPAGGGSVQPAVVAHPALWPSAHSQGLVDARTEAFVSRIMAGMTLEQKVGQMIQADIGQIRPADLERYPLGSILAGGDSPPLGAPDRSGPQAWLATSRAFQAVALRKGGPGIPLMFGVDAVHGNNNVVGATLFPHNVGLGAMRDPALMRKIGEATAQETAAAGIDWAFGPTLAVPQDDRWGRTYEGYSERPEVVRAYAGEMVKGLQGDPAAWPAPAAGAAPAGLLQQGHVAASAKHFLADGGTANGEDQGDAQISEAELIRIHDAGYPAAIDAGVMSVMVSFSSWNGAKMSGDRSLLTDVLKGRMGFEGLVVSDWNAHGQVPGCTTTDCPAAFNAGIDMLMAADSWKGLYDSTLREARAGTIPMSRIDDAVRRILRVKTKLGLFDPARPREGRFQALGAADHRAIARQAVRESLVLLKNNGGVLPLKGSAHVLVAGDAANEVARQSGGWTLSWQGTGNSPSDFPGATTIFAGLRDALAAEGGAAEYSADGRYTRKPDAAVVVFGEHPTAEFQGDVADLAYRDAENLKLLKRLKGEGIPVVTVFLSGRPLWANPELNASDAFVAAWFPGSEGEGVADVIVGDQAGAPRRDFTGKLSYAWPRTALQTGPKTRDADPLFPFGYGLSYADHKRLAVLPEVSGVSLLAPNLDRYFVGGRVLAPWRLILSGHGDQVADAAQGAAIPGRISLTHVDANGVQEAGRQVSWSGAGEASFGVVGPTADLQRQANGDMVLEIGYRIDAPPTGTVALSTLGKTPGVLDVTAALRAAPIGKWSTMRVKLACFRKAGGDLSALSSPATLTTAGKLTLSISQVKLTPNAADAGCP